MLDFRINTFIELCKTKNYTKTAENLHMTQPAVTQHIKFLEEYYKCKLFNYSNRTLTLTEYGDFLYKYILTMNSDEKKIKEDILNINSNKKNLYIGATLTIGEYLMPNIILKFAEKYPDTNVSLVIKDTSILLEDLKNGEIEFALVEGFFEKTEYDSFLFSKEKFVGVCSCQNKLADKSLRFEDIFSERIILREKGSGSRDIFEKILYENNFSINSFPKKYEFQNINLIKDMVKKDVGITFIYKMAVQGELNSSNLKVLKIKNFNAEREFNFVFLKNSIHKEEYKKWFDFMKKVAE